MRYPFNKKNIQKKIDVSASRNYSIMIQCNSGIEPLQNLLKKYGGFYVVTDANLSKQQEGFLSSLQKHSRYKGITITKPGEKSKEWHILHSLLTDMLNADMDRNSLVIAFGRFGGFPVYAGSRLPDGSHIFAGHGRFECWRKNRDQSHSRKKPDRYLHAAGSRLY